MAQSYRTVTNYVVNSRFMLQDKVAPYRYDDNTLIQALNHGMGEFSRVRPDIFLDLKYQMPMMKGDLDDGLPQPYTTTDIFINPDGTYDPTKGTLVPLPSKYITMMEWFMNGWVQFSDVTDTQDQRAQGFLQKFNSQLLSLTAA